jgi:CHRD domain-containing protein
MRHLGALMAALVGAGCGDPTPTSAIGDSAPLLSNVQSELVPPVLFNTQMRSELEVPACASASKGHAQVKILQDGTIEAMAIINNTGGESVRFGHIHHLNPGEATGPIIWWLTTPIGVDLNLTEQHIDVRQEGVFVANPHFATAELALAELLSEPSSFYVNFHSDVCPGGFARGFLP